MSNNEREWSQEETDRVLMVLRFARHDAEYKGICDALAVDLDRVGSKGKPKGATVERFMWGLATRYRQYTPNQDNQRPNYYGPLTFAEIYWMTLARDTATEERTQYPDAAYFALLLNRPIADVEPAWKQYGPARGRGSIFDLKR